MDKSEDNYYHAYQDLKDKLDEKIRVRTLELLTQFWNDETRILDSFNECLINDDEYIRLIMVSHQLDNPKGVGEITLDLINKYLHGIAEEEAENQLT